MYDEIFIEKHIILSYLMVLSLLSFFPCSHPFNNPNRNDRLHITSNGVDKVKGNSICNIVVTVMRNKLSAKTACIVVR